MIKVGILGFGKMGRIRAQALESTGKAKVVCVYDVDISGDQKYPMEATHDDLIKRDDIQAVVVSVPNFLNYDYTVKALQAGKHVFCEKPPAFTVKEVQHIREVEAVSGRKLMYGFNHRHHDAVMKMKSLIDMGEYGKILWMRGRYGKSVDESYLNTWRAKKETAGGGILFDQGIHMLDLFLYMGARFDQVHAFVSNLYWQMDGVEDNVFAIMKNSRTGMVASLHSTMTQWRHLFSLEVFLESGYMVLNGLKTSSGTYGEEELSVAKNRSKAPAATWDDEERFHFAIDNSWKRESEHFIGAILNDEEVSIGHSGDALAVMELIEDIYNNERQESEELHTQLNGNVENYNAQLRDDGLSESVRNT